MIKYGDMASYECKDLPFFNYENWESFIEANKSDKAVLAFEDNPLESFTLFLLQDEEGKAFYSFVRYEPQDKNKRAQFLNILKKTLEGKI